MSKQLCLHGFRTELVEGTDKAILNEVGAWLAVMQSLTPSDDVGKKEKLLEKGFSRSHLAGGPTEYTSHELTRRAVCLYLRTREYNYIQAIRPTPRLYSSTLRLQVSSGHDETPPNRNNFLVASIATEPKHKRAIFA